MLNTIENPAKSLLGQETVMLTIFWPLNIKIKPIKRLKSEDDICVIFNTLSHNRGWEYNKQQLPLMHDHKNP